MRSSAPSSGRSRTASRHSNASRPIRLRASHATSNSCSELSPTNGDFVMEGPTAVMLALIIIGLPTIMLMLAFNRFFKFRERKLEVEALNAAEKAAQYASRTHELEERVRVLEQIVTDGGAQTAAQIEALRPKRVTKRRADA